MINSPLQGIDNEKLALIPGRFEDLKKFWKTLKSALVESLTTFSYFGKSMVKGSRTLQLSFNHADPSYICKLTLNLLTRQSQISHVIYKSIDEALRALNKNIESYEKELEEARVKSLDAINESIKQLVLARTNYAKDKANYEKVCKETETAVIEKKKPSADPLIFYNMTHQRKLEQKVAEALKTLKAAEQQAQDALELYSSRQQSLSAALVESMTSFKATLSTLLGNMIENVKRHNTILSEFFKKELDDFEANQSISSLDGFVLCTEQEEQQYIENRKLPHPELLDSSPRRDQSPKKEIDPAWKDFKGKFVVLQSRLIESPDELSDFEISEYFEIVQKHYEGALTVFEERHKVIRGVRIYMQDLSNLSATVDKIFQKLSKSSMSQLCTTVLGKKLGSTIDPLFEGFGSFGSVFQQLSAYINAKGPVLDIVLNDQKEQLKVFQVEFTKIFKDSNVVRTSLVSSGLQQERLKRKISEINEKDGEDDNRLPVLKTELENTRKQREDLLQNLRKKTVDEAKELSKIFGVYRTQEQAKFEDFSNVIKGFLTQEHIFFKGLFDSLTKTESSLQVEINIDEEIAKAIEQDEPLAGFFKHIEKNMASKEGEGETSKPQTMVLKKMYTPPEDLEVDEEQGLADGDEDIDQEKGEDEENNKKLAKRFGLKNNEKYIDSYACGVEQKILRQGRMYMYSTAICFSTSKILGDIALSIPLADISKIEKKTMSLVFDTALSITTKNGEIKFLSFFYRDRAYNLIVTLKKESSLAKDANASLASTADSLGISVRQKSKSEFAIRLESQAIEKSKSDKTEETMLERRAGSVEEESGSENQGDMRRKSLVLTEEESAGIKKAGSENGSSRRDSQEIKKEDDKSSNVSIKLDNSSMSEDKDGEDHVPHPESKKSKFSTAHYLTTKMTSPLALSYGIKAKGFQNAAAAYEEEPLSGFEAGSSNVGSSKEASATESKNEENILNTKEVEKSNVSEVRDEEKNKGKANAINQDNEPKGTTNTEKVLPKNEAEVSEKPNENKTNTQKETKPAHPEEKVLKRKDSEEVLREQQHQQELEEAKEKKKLKALIEQRKLKVRKMLLGDEKFETIVVQEVLPCTALDVYNTAFNDKKLTHKGKHYDSFWMLVKAEAGDTNIKCVKWSPHVPLEGLYSDKESVECLKRVAEGSQKSLRDFSYTHPVKGGGPFVPKECQVEEKQTGYWIGPDEFEMQIQVFTSKVPLSDCFVVHNSWKAKDLPNGKCEFVWRLGVEFVKSTFFKGKISSTSKEENGDYANKIFMPLLKEHLSIYLKEKAHDIKKREAKKESDKEAARQERAKRKAEALQKAQEEAEAKSQEEEHDSTKETKPEEMSPIKEEEETSPSKQEESIIKDSVIVEEKKIEEQGKEVDEAKSSEEEKSVDELSQGTEPVGRKDVEDLMGSGVTLRGSFADDFAKFVKASEQNREEMKKEISGLKNLIMVLIAMNCFLVLLYFFKG